MNYPGNILIVRNDRIGDVILTLPIAGILKNKFPESKITFLVRDYTKDLVIKHPLIDNVIVLKEAKGKVLISENIKKISEQKFDTCIFMYPTFTLALIIFLGGIKNRIGSGYRWYSFLFNNRIFQHRKYAEMHELEFNVNLLRSLGINERVTPENVKFNLNIDEMSNAKIKDILSKDGAIKEKIILIHPGSGGSAIDLPMGKFKELIIKLSELGGIKIILTGNNTEKKLCNLLQINENILNFAGLFNLSELTALINNCDLLVANSTGPLHIAVALNKKVIGFYPKILACSPKRWGPYTKKSTVFVPKIGCTDCSREQCERLNCMNSIDMNEVASVIKNDLNVS